MDILLALESMIADMKPRLPLPGNPPDMSKPPFIFSGHPVQINREVLAAQANSPTVNLKYPAFFVRLDTPEVFENGFWKYNLNIAIVEFTERNYRTEQRRDNVVNPILEPLYKKFIDMLPAYNFQWTGDLTKPPHTKIVRYFLGTPAKDRNTENAFSDPLDAIELQNLKISINETTCP